MAVKPFPRAGAFAVLNKEVGIIFQYPQVNSAGVDNDRAIDTLDEKSAEFHVLAPDGTTERVLRNVPVTSLRQATVKQIPARRRPSEAAARKYGYL